MRYLLLCLCSFASITHASPPNSVNLSDTFLGANDDQIFLLRSIDDNLGVNSPAALDLYLIARSRSGASADEVWPIRRKIDYASSDEKPDKFVEIPAAIDPFDVMAKREAWPWAMHRTHGLSEVKYENGKIIALATTHSIIGDGPEKMSLITRFQMPLAKAVKQIMDGHAGARNVLEQYPGMNLGEDSIYIFKKDTFSKHCKAQSSGYLFGDEGQISTLLVELKCADPEVPFIKANVFLMMPINLE